jgi:hypothetical protein
MVVVGIFGFIPGGFIASYINFRFHQMGENMPMAGLSAGFFTAFVYTIIQLMTTVVLSIGSTASAGNYFIAWIIAVVFAFMFMPVGGYLSGTLETRPFAMPSFFNLSRISREPPPPPPTNVQQCPTCGKPLTLVQQYNRSYCTNCKKYP